MLSLIVRSIIYCCIVFFLVMFNDQKILKRACLPQGETHRSILTSSFPIYSSHQKNSSPVCLPLPDEPLQKASFPLLFSFSLFYRNRMNVPDFIRILTNRAVAGEEARFGNVDQTHFSPSSLILITIAHPLLRVLIRVEIS